MTQKEPSSSGQGSASIVHGVTSSMPFSNPPLAISFRAVTTISARAVRPFAVTPVTVYVPGPAIASSSSFQVTASVVVESS